MTDQMKPDHGPERKDQAPRMTLSRETSHGIAAAPAMDDAEAQMRRALGLFGDQPRPRTEPDRQEPAARSGGFNPGGFNPGGFQPGGLHRRRFVQDGEIPVTVVRRDAPEAAPGQSPQSSRLQRTEAALAAETAARDRAERSLHETQAALQALQTKIGHNELAKNEAIATVQRLRDEIAALKQEVSGTAERITELEERAEAAEEELLAVRAELTEERRARKLAERQAEAVPVRKPVLVVPDEHVEPPRPRRGRPPNARPEPVAEDEPEPVKWWLTPQKAAVKRR